MIINTKRRLTPLQRVRALKRMQRELRDMIHDELAELKDVVDGIERDYAKAVARAMAERDPA